MPLSRNKVSETCAPIHLQQSVSDREHYPVIGPARLELHLSLY